MEIKKKYKTKKQLVQAKKKNAKLFPIYRMFSWDLLFFYSIQFLFYTITKGISGADVLKISALYPICNILWQMPAIICSDWLGRKNSIVLGNVIIGIYLLVIIFVPGALGIIIGNIICSFGYSLKNLQESNLLYDSVSTRGGDGLFSKINEKGGSGYYILDGIASLMAGYLFVINNYLPIYICLGFIIISTIISCGFQDIYQTERNGISLKEKVKDYEEDLKGSLKAIGKSKRLRSLIAFGAVFLSLITIEDTYRESLLTTIGVEPQTFSIIFAILILVGGISVGLQEKLHKKYRNRTLKVISFTYVSSMLGIGLLLLVTQQNSVYKIVPVILLLYAVQYVIHSNFYLLEDRYLKNFSNPKNRGRISFSYEVITNIVIAIFSFAGGLLLDWVEISYAFLLTGLAFLAILIVVLDYMRKHFGLAPEEYTKEDIEF